MSRRFVKLSFLINVLIYFTLLLILDYETELSKYGVSFVIVPIAPIVIACGIFTAKSVSEIIFYLIVLFITINAIVQVILSIWKHNLKSLLYIAHISLIFYWGWSLLFLITLK